MVASIQILRSITPGNRPAGRQYGEPYVNFGDNQFGVFDSTNTPRDLLGVPIFSTALSYVAGAIVRYQGKAYTAVANVSAGVWNATQWAHVVGNASRVVTTSSDTISVGDDNSFIIYNLGSGPISVTVPTGTTFPAGWKTTLYVWNAAFPGVTVTFAGSFMGTAGYAVNLRA